MHVYLQKIQVRVDVRVRIFHKMKIADGSAFNTPFEYPEVRSERPSSRSSTAGANRFTNRGEANSSASLLRSHGRINP